jgi:hypothetical protein
MDYIGIGIDSFVCTQNDLGLPRAKLVCIERLPEQLCFIANEVLMIVYSGPLATVDMLKTHNWEIATNRFVYTIN